MGKIKLPAKAKLFFAILYSDETVYSQALKNLTEKFGEMDEEVPPFRFDLTGYYEKEMGVGLEKGFVTAKELVDKSTLAEIKLYTNSIEERYQREDGDRRINIDPGYITPSKLVLATTKNYQHRIYLRGGIFAEITLNFKKGHVEFNPWTYPDYKLKTTTDFFLRVRNKYMKSLRRDS
ncbi:MAG: hypothetical protein A2042_08350 [Candidatus Schekmanbacteria bacterium GWA2_38_11]|uniref:GTP-binding protein n=1 Tax=Candidatus Schekmanbacteria bacterium GWA2_38_11 TaxID=1817876 RepID=A0A1F7RDI2_9BACT|nr:MAG: hypothetical protein A2042_08350 [Candidatus Schekmanbacteria bacterium GWA2_38_11]